MKEGTNKIKIQFLMFIVGSEIKYEWIFQQNESQGRVAKTCMAECYFGNFEKSQPAMSWLVSVGLNKNK